MTHDHGAPSPAHDQAPIRQRPQGRSKQPDSRPAYDSAGIGIFD